MTRIQLRVYHGKDEDEARVDLDVSIIPGDTVSGDKVLDSTDDLIGAIFEWMRNI